MIYPKPKDVTYTQMAIYIDNHIYEEDCDEATCFIYMYHLFYILAVKKCYFTSGKDYEDYALFGASRLYQRYKNPKQFIEDEGKRLKKITSSLNYIKNILYPTKVDYLKQSSSVMDLPLYFGVQSNLKEEVIEKASFFEQEFDRVAFEDCLASIGYYFKQEINNTPYKKDKITCKNLYISCILSFLNSITLESKQEKKLLNSPLLDYGDVIGEDFNSVLLKNIVIYHLDKSLKNYIAFIINRAKKNMAKDLLYKLGYTSLSNIDVRELLSPIPKIKKEDFYD